MTTETPEQTGAASNEPAWVRHAIWWRIYPLGFVGAYPASTGESAEPGEHRLRRVIDWLDHAARLGASGIALGPVFTSATHGYDTIDHLHIDPRLGTDDDFDHLVAECHRRGLRVQLDGVFNHVARTHPRALAAQADGPDSPDASWFRTSRSEGNRTVFDTFEGHDALVTLDHKRPEVRDLVVTVLRHWLDRGADSWRLDAAYAVPTDFWAHVLPRVRATHPDVYVEAEVIHGDYAAFVTASTVDTVTQYELWKAIHSAINDRNFHELNWALARHNQMLSTFTPATFIGNHDVTRIATQIEDRRHLPHAIALLALLGGTPTVYGGDEHALHGLKEDRTGGDDAIRPEFPADPTHLAERDANILRLHQQLLGLRRRHPWLHSATTTAAHLDNQYYSLRITHQDNTLHLHLNLSDSPLRLPHGAELIASDPDTSTQDQLAPHGWAVTDSRKYAWLSVGAAEESEAGRCRDGGGAS